MSRSQTESALEVPVLSAAGRAAMLSYGVLVYLIFLGTFLYVIGFIGGFAVPKTIDDGLVGPVGQAVLVNLGFLSLFAVQHTIMARPAFKRWWAKYVPPAAERSTFVMVTNAILIAMVWQWRPMPDTVWQAEGALAIALDASFAFGWAIVLASTFLIDHFELFGLKQTCSAALNRPREATPFQERFLYRYTRHPLMLGFMIAFWSASSMSEGRLFFAAVTTAYIVVALYIEEHTLVELHGEAYEEYQRRVPKLIPGLRW